MSGPVMKDVKTLIEAGINPKTGLPYRYKGQTGPELFDELLKPLRIQDECRAVNRYVWHNCPPGLNSQLIERILYYKGNACLFYEPNLELFFCLPYTLASDNKSLDVYGRFLSIMPIRFSGSNNASKDGKGEDIVPYIVGKTLKPIYDVVDPLNFKPEMIKENCVLLNDYSKQISQKVLPRQMLNEVLLQLEDNCLCYMNTFLKNSTGVDAIKVNSPDESSNIMAANESLDRAAINGQRLVGIVGGLDWQNLASNSAGRAQEFLMSAQSIDNMLLGLYGLESGGLFDKKSYVNKLGESMNQSQTSLLLQDGLTIRQEAADIFNSIYGTMLYPDINECVSGVDANMDGLMQYDYDAMPISEQVNTQMEANEDVTE